MLAAVWKDTPVRHDPLDATGAIRSASGSAGKSGDAKQHRQRCRYGDALGESRASRMRAWAWTQEPDVEFRPANNAAPARSEENDGAD